MQEFQLTHAADGVSRFTVNKSAVPLVYVDVVYQHLYTEAGEARGSIKGQPYTYSYEKGATMRMAFAFAKGEQQIADLGAEARLGIVSDADMYLIWIAVDGVGAEGQRKLALRRNTKGQYDVSVPLYG